MTVLEVVEKNALKTDNKTGIYAPTICELTGLDWFETKKELNKLFKEDKITIKQGVNGKLIFKK